MATPTTEPRSRLSLGARIFLATALVVTLAAGVAIAATYLLGAQVAESALRDNLERSGRVQSIFQDSRLEQLRLATHLVAGDPAFFAHVADSIDRGDDAPLRDALEQRRREMGFAFAIVLDADGLVLARAGEKLTPEDDFSAEPLYLRALEDHDATGLWAREGRLFSAAAVPIVASGLPRGFMIAAEAIDDAQAGDLRRAGATGVTFILTPPDGAPARVATTLKIDIADALVAAVTARPGLLAEPGAAPRRLGVELGQGAGEWLALVRPFTDAGGGTLGAAVHVASLEGEIEPYRRVSRILAAVGLAAILLALPISLLLPRRLLAPISRLTAATRAAAEGDYDQQIRVGSGDEVGRLTTAFQTLLSELREKRDMEVYVSEISRGLPDTDASGSETAAPAAPAPEAPVPEASEVALLGLELRDYSISSGTGDGPIDPGQTLEVLSHDLRCISSSVQTQGGRVESLLGHRLLASFPGPRRCQQALSATAGVIARRAPSPAAPVFAAAMVVGPAVTGTVTVDDRPERAIAGWPVEQLEGLLRVARTGTLLFSKAAHDELAKILSLAGVTPQEHRSTVSSSPLFSLTADAVSTFRGPEGSTTLEKSPAEPAAASAPAPSGIGPGRVLARRFEILSELDASDTGVVYKARDRTLNELVALKLLEQEVSGDSRLDRLEGELRLARKVSHVNVLRTFDFGEADGFPFISVEYVRGITLRDLLDRSGSLPLSAGLRLSRQLCRGLWAAHSQSVLHRDIKPENLIIEHNGNAKLTGLGTARPIRRPSYLAPEQLEGTEPDERADIYACGVVFYEVFTGNLPFRADGDPLQVIRRKVNEDPKPPSEHWPTMPHTLEDIIMRCLERDREKRFGDVGKLLKELEILRAWAPG